MSLKDLIARDIANVFLNADEFCDNITIQIGSKRFPVVGSLQQNLVQNNSGNGGVLQRISDVLYIKYPLDPLEGLDYAGIVLSAGTRITINDKPYTVVDVSNEMGLATISLQTASGRQEEL